MDTHIRCRGLDKEFAPTNHRNLDTAETVKGPVLWLPDGQTFFDSTHITILGSKSTLKEPRSELRPELEEKEERDCR